MARRLFYLNEVRSKRGYIRGESADHLRRVLRVETGQTFELSDGQRFYLGQVAEIARSEIEFTLTESREPVPAALRVNLLASLIKFDHFEWLLEKATELGVDEITPIQALRSEKGLEQAALKRAERWNRIVRESGQQCRRVNPPTIHPPVKFRAALDLSAPCRLRLEEESGDAVAILKAAPKSGQVLLLVGPEGGWDDRERLQANQLGWTAVSLGPQILRAETASLAALSALNAHAHAG